MSQTTVSEWGMSKFLVWFSSDKLLRFIFKNYLAQNQQNNSTLQTSRLLDRSPESEQSTRWRLTYLLSFPGYICVYSTRYFLAKSMKAFIGRLHFVGVAPLAVPEVCPLFDLLAEDSGELERSSLSQSGLTAPPLDREVRRWRAMLLRTYTAEESSGVKS